MKINPKAESNEIISHLMKTLKFKTQEKIFAIAVANETIKMKKDYKGMSDKDIVQKVLNNKNKIILTSY